MHTRDVERALNRARNLRPVLRSFQLFTAGLCITKCETK